MRIRRQPAAFGKFLPEILQVALVQPAFEKGARIHAGRGVTLKINDVAGKIRRRATEKMILCRLRKASPKTRTKQCDRQRSCWNSP